MLLVLFRVYDFYVLPDPGIEPAITIYTFISTVTLDNVAITAPISPAIG